MYGGSDRYVPANGVLTRMIHYTHSRTEPFQIREDYVIQSTPGVDDSQPLCVSCLGQLGFKARGPVPCTRCMGVVHYRCRDDYSGYCNNCVAEGHDTPTPGPRYSLTFFDQG